MILGGRDLFEFWRLALTTTCCIYAAVMMARSLWRIAAYLSADDRTASVMRSYVVVQVMRLRLRRFTGEFVRIGLCLVILAAVLYAHTWI